MVTSCEFTGLVSGVTYTFSVVVTNGVGSSAATVSAPVVAGSDATAPSAPSAVTGVAGNSTVTVSWFAPASTGGSPITGYVVTDGDGAVVCSTVETSCTITGLANGTSYTFTVVASNAIGSSDPSVASDPITPATVPGAPTGVAGISFQNASTVLSWTAPASNGGAAVTGYVVTVVSAIVTSAGVVLAGPVAGDVVCTTASTSCVIGGLTNGVTYTFTVVATNAAGSSVASTASASVVPATVPDAPTNLIATPFAAGSVKVTLTRPLFNGGSTMKGFGFVITVVGGTQSCTDPGLVATVSCVISGLTNGVTYTFTATASNAAGTGVASAESNPIVLADPPGAPTNVVATATENRQSTISWTAPADTGGFPITGYLVTTSGSTRTCATAGETTCVVTLLTNGTAYTFSVVAITDAGRSDTAVSNTIIPATVPSKITTFTPIFGNGSITLTWTAPATGGADITGYTITDATTAAVVCTTTTATSCTISGLTNGTAYSFKVVATNAAGTGLISNASTPTTPATTPGAPTSVTATSNTNTSSVIAWTAPADNGGSVVTSYLVTATPGGATCSATTKTTCTIVGLTNGLSYTFTVTATNKAGTSTASDPSNIATPSTVPGAPTGVTGTSNENTQSTITWTAPTSNGGATITGYKVTATPGGRTCTTTGETTCVITGLTNGTAYTFKVVAINASGNSALSTASSAVVPATIPGAPTNITASSNANAQSVIAWTAPADNGGTAITGYLVTANPGGRTCTTARTTCTVTGLANGTSYTFTVTATNAAGTSTASDASNIATPSTVPGAPTGVGATAAESGRSTIAWTAPASDGGAAISGYRVTATPGGKSCTTTGATTCTITGLSNGTSYTFTVTATNRSGTGSPSDPSTAVVPSTVPGAPTGVAASSFESTQSTVTWIAPASNGGAAITTYTVVSTPGSRVCTTSGDTSCVVTGLTNGTSYTFKVTATNVSGTSAASIASAAAVPATVPGAPINVAATSNANASSSISWTAPTSNGGAPITAYTVTANPGGATCTTATTTCTITGLSNGSSYTFTVTTTNNAGTGSSSAASNTAIPSTVPNAPTGVGAISFESTQSTISWTASTNDGGAAITGYRVTSNPGGRTCTTTTTSCVVKGLTNGTDYTFTVVALNARGASSASDASGIATPSTVPGAPTGAVGVFADSSAIVSWTAPSTDGGADITSSTVTATPGGATCTTATTSCVVPGLINGTSYRFTVTATNGSGTGGSSVASAAVIPMKVPDAPNAPVGVSYLSGRTTLTWTAPANNAGTPVTGYVVRNAAGEQVCTTTGALTCSVTGLTNGTTYTFTVMARNKVGDGGVSPSSDGVLVSTVPSAPTGQIAVFGDRSITVSWTAPADNGGAPITGYVVANSAGTLGCTTNGETSCVVTGLTNGTSYTFRVLAINGSGRGATSGYTIATVPATVPNPPTTVTTVFADASATVSWIAPADNGGSIVTGYTVTANPGVRSCTTASVTATTCVVTGLANGTSYMFTVTATNKAGTGAASDASAPVVPATVPDQPTDVATSFDVVAGTMTLTWNAPAWNGGSAITAYSVLSTPGNKVCATTGALTCVITGLTNGTAYTFTVRASNKAGTGSFSTPSASIVPIMVPQAPTAVTGTFGNTTATIRWTAPVATSGTAVTGYTVTASPDGASCTTAGATTCTVTGLANGTAYTFTVTATNIVGTGSASTASAPVIPATVPSSPVITSVAYADSSVTVTWTASDDNGGSVITDYVVTSKPGTKTCSSSGALACTVTGLTNGTAYTFTVRAVNKAGSSIASAASDSTIPGTVPSVPRNVAATSGDARSSTVTWTAPADTGGYAITGYLLIASDDSTCEPARLTTLSCTFTSLKNGTNYTFTVYALNANGRSVAGSATGKPSREPDEPYDVVATPYQNGRSLVSWTAPGFDGGAKISGYTVISSPGNTSCTTSLPGETSCVVTGLTNGTAYRFTVTATNRSGTGAASLPSLRVVPAAAPDAPTNIAVTPTGSRTVTVTWKAPRVDGGTGILGYVVVSTPATDKCITNSADAVSCTFTWLTNGTSYTFKVKARNAAGTGDASSDSAAVTPVSVPDAPTDVVAVPYQNTQSTVSWTAPFNNGLAISSYVVTASPGGRTCTASTSRTVLVAPTSCVVTGLTNGTYYSFTVTATNSRGTSPVSVADSGVLPASVPSAPSITTTTYDDQSISVYWNPPVSDGGAPILGYTVTSTPGSFTCTTAQVSCVMNGLTNGTAYTFVVTASNGAGTSTASGRSASTTPITVPHAPRNVVATPRLDGQSVVSWDAPNLVGGSPIISYTVTSHPDLRTCTVTKARNGTVPTSCTVTGLTNGVIYTFDVVATNAAGDSEGSDRTDDTKPSTVPDAPSIKDVKVEDDTALIIWEDPAFDGGATITGYLVTGFIGSKAAAGISCSSESRRRCTVSGLVWGTTYSFKVKAINGRGAGANSASSDPVTPVNPPSAPRNVVGTSYGDTTSVVSWAASSTNRGSAITGYVVTAFPGGATCSVVAPTRTCTITGLTNGVPHRFRVYAVNAVGAGDISDRSEAVTPSTVPGAPAVNSVQAGNASAFVTVIAPASNGGAPITLYRITSYPEAKYCETADPAAGCTVTGLTNGTNYQFYAAAINGSGTGAFSERSAVVTPKGPPGAPTGATAVAGAGSATIRWAAPTINGGSPVTGYIVTSSPDGLTCSSSSLSCTMAGLTNGTAYTFTVQAINAIGTGSSSVPSSAVTPSTTPGVPVVTNVTPGNGTVTISWSLGDNGGATVTKYQVQRCAGSTCSLVTTADASTFYTFTGLVNGTDYVFTVKAYNAKGYGLASDYSIVGTPRTVPAAPTSVSAIAYAGSAKVTWSVPSSNGSAITSYTVTADPGGASCTAITTSCIVSGLSNGTSYTFTVTAANVAGAGPASGASTAVTPRTLPDAPTSVSATSNEDSKSTVSWSAPSNGGSVITGYTVSDDAGHTCSTSGTSCVVTGLSNGVGVTFSVTATTAVGTSEASARSSVSTPAAVPGAPTFVGVQQSGEFSAKAVWEAPTIDGGSAITGYSVRNSSGTEVCSAAASERLCMIRGLAKGTSYSFTVRAINAAGTGTASSAVSFSLATPTSTKKIIYDTYVAGEKSISADWTWGGSWSGTAKVYAYTGTLNTSTAAKCTSTGTSCTISDLPQGTYNVAIFTNYSDTVAQRTVTGVKVYARPGKPQNVTGTAGVGSVSVSWNAPSDNGGLAISRYVVESTPGGFKCRTSLTSCTVFGLANNTSYRFTVKAVNGVNDSFDSDQSASITTLDSPNAPNNVAATAGEGSATVSWTAPNNTGGSAITGYRVKADPGGALCITTGTSCTFNGLTPGQGYTFVVKAINAVGASNWTGDSNRVTPTIPRTAPTAPFGVSAVPSNTQVTISWSAPSNGGADITSYTVTSSPSSYTCSTSGLSCVISGLTNGAGYTFTVTATNVIGTGAASAASISAAPYTVPSVPTGVSATSDENASSTVSWSAPASSGGATILSYRATAYRNGNQTSKVCVTANGSTLSCVISGLNNGNDYTFRVEAFNRAGGSGTSNASSVATPRTVPDAPSILSLQNGYGRVKVSWNAPGFNGGANLTGYTVSASPGGQTCTSDSSTLNCWVMNLTADTSYSFTVVATNRIGSGAASLASAGMIPKMMEPEAPVFVSIYSNGLSSVNASWTAPNARGAVITGYTITSFDLTTNSVGAGCTTVGQMLGCDITGLTSGDRYTFSITATNEVGTSAAGTKTITVGLTFNPAAANGMFFIPKQLAWDDVLQTGSGTTSLVMGFESGSALERTVTSTSGGDATVSWTAPTLANGRSIVGYVVTVKGNPSMLQSCTTTTTSCTVTGLNGSTSITFTITPFSGGLLPVVVRMKEPTVWTVTALPALATVKRNLSGSDTASKPTELTAVAGNGAVTLSWKSPMNAVPGQLYLVQATPTTPLASGDHSGDDLNCVTAFTACTVGGLSNATSYTFRVRGVSVNTAASSNGAVVLKLGVQSDAVTSTPLNTIPSDQLRINAAYSVSGLQMVRTNASTTYQLAGSIILDDSGTQSMQVLVNWTSGSSWSITAVSAPDTPSNVQLTRNLSDTSIRVSWDAPNDNGSAITGYRVTVTGAINTGGTTPMGCTAGPNATSCVVNDVITNDVYTATVVATNVVGDSDPSAAQVPGMTLLSETNKLNLPAYLVPSAPRNVSVVAGVSEVTVSWTAPATAIGASVRSYTVSSDRIDSLDSVVHTCTTTTALSCKVTGLYNGLSYTFTVTATSSQGTSTGARSNSIKPGLLGPEDPQTPDSVTGVSVVSLLPAPGGVLSNNAVISWTAAKDNGSPIIGYVVKSTPDNLQCTTTTSSCMIPNLVTGRSYTFRVTAYNRVGYSPSVSTNAVVGGTLSAGDVAPPSSRVSFFGADPVRVSGTITASMSGGKLVLGGQFTSGSFTATAGSLNVKSMVMTWKAAAQGADSAGWSGTGKVALGFGLEVGVKVTAYTDGGTWTLTAQTTTGTPEIMKDVTLPSITLAGTIDSAAGSVTWSLSATLGQLNLIPGLLKLQDISLSVSNACPMVAGTKTTVCPRGNNGIYLIAQGKVSLTVSNKDYASLSAYLVMGLDSRTMVLAAKLSDIDFGAGVVLTGPMIQVYQATAGSDPTRTAVAIASVPGQPQRIQFDPVSLLGESKVSWDAPISDGGSPILGYTVTATPVSSLSDTKSLDPVTCTVGADGVTVTTKPANVVDPDNPDKKKTDFEKANPKRKTQSVTSLNTWCLVTGLEYGVQYTYSVTATNTVGQGIAGVSTTFKGVQIQVEGLAKAQLSVVLTGAISFNTIGLTVGVAATVFPVGSDGKPLSATNPLPPGTTVMWGFAIAGTVSVQGGGNAPQLMKGLDFAGSFAFTTSAATARMDSTTVELPERSAYFGVSLTLSNDMKKVLKGVDRISGFVWYSMSNNAWGVQFQLDTGWVAKVNKVQLGFTQTKIAATGTGLQLEEMSIEETGFVTFPNKDGSSTTIRATLGVTFGSDFTVTFGITLSPGNAGDAIWPSMFGYKGVDLMTGSLSVGFDGKTGFPILGLMGTVRFPTSITKALGGSAPMVVTLAGMMSTSTPCASISVAAEDGVSNVVNIGNGVLTASKFSMGLAPNGCTIGAGDNAFTMPAGASISIAGSMMGVNVKVEMTLTIEEQFGGAIPNITITGSATVDGFKLGQLQMDPSVLELELTTKIGGLEHFKLSGGASLLGAKFTASAEANYTLGSTDLDIKMSASLTHATISGIGFDDLSFSYSLSSTSVNAFSVAFSARIGLAPGFNITASGSITPTKFELTSSSEINWGGLKYKQSSTVVLSVSSSAVPLVLVSTQMQINLWGTYFDGTMTVTNDENGYRAVTQFIVQLKIGGWNFGSATFTDMVTISGDQVMFRRRLNSQLNLGVLQGTLDAEVAAGDDGTNTVLLFNLYIDMTVRIGSFETTAKVHLADCGDPCVRYTAISVEVAFSADFGPYHLTSQYYAVRTDFNFDISVSKDFDASSGIIYGCSNCSDPQSAGLLRWQASFRGSASIRLSSTSGLSFSTNATAQIKQSASKGECARWNPAHTICNRTEYSWGSFTDLVKVNISIGQDGKARSSSAGKDYEAEV